MGDEMSNDVDRCCKHTCSILYSSKKEVISVDEDANEGPSKKARYDSDSEQGSDGDFAEKLLEGMV